MPAYTPIPIPFERRMHRLRTKWMPVVAVAVAVGFVVYLWDRELTPTGMVGEVFGQTSEIVAPQAGTLADLHLDVFDRVAAGQTVGLLQRVPPEQLEAAMAVVRAEMELTRQGDFGPTLDRQRNLQSAVELHQDLLGARAERAAVGIRRAQAEREFNRFQALAVSQAVAASELDRLEAEASALAAEERGWSERVAALEQAQTAQPMPTASDLPASVETALAWQEKQLALIEAELAPLPLRSPTAGVVVRPLRRAGQYVVAGEVIAIVRSETPEYIIGYLSPPVMTDPEPGMEVEIIPRGDRSARMRSLIVAVGTEFEALGPIFQGPFSAAEERALPVKIAIPPGLRVRPGELVDIRLVRTPVGA